MKRKCLALFLIVLMLLSTAPAMAESANPAAWLKTDEQRASVVTLTDVNDGKLYTFVSNHPLGGQEPPRWARWTRDAAPLPRRARRESFSTAAISIIKWI